MHQNSALFRPTKMTSQKFSDPLAHRFHTKKIPPRIPIFVIEHFLVGMHFSEKIYLFHGEAIS